MQFVQEGTDIRRICCSVHLVFRQDCVQQLPGTPGSGQTVPQERAHLRQGKQAVGIVHRPAHGDQEALSRVLPLDQLFANGYSPITFENRTAGGAVFNLMLIGLSQHRTTRPPRFEGGCPSEAQDRGEFAVHRTFQSALRRI